MVAGYYTSNLSIIDSLIYRWTGTSFLEVQRITAQGMGLSVGRKPSKREYWLQPTSLRIPRWISSSSARRGFVELGA